MKTLELEDANLHQLTENEIIEVDGGDYCIHALVADGIAFVSGVGSGIADGVLAGWNSFKL